MGGELLSETLTLLQSCSVKAKHLPARCGIIPGATPAPNMETTSRVFFVRWCCIVCRSSPCRSSRKSLGMCNTTIVVRGVVLRLKLGFLAFFNDQRPEPTITGTPLSLLYLSHTPNMIYDNQTTATVSFIRRGFRTARVLTSFPQPQNKRNRNAAQRKWG